VRKLTSSEGTDVLEVARRQILPDLWTAFGNECSPVAPDHLLLRPLRGKRFAEEEERSRHRQGFTAVGAR
jgi:hypothetical protein